MAERSMESIRLSNSRDHQRGNPLIGSVGRSLVFRHDAESSNTTAELNSEGSPPLTGTRPLANKINSCIRKSIIFVKPPSSPRFPWPLRSATRKES
ncbi:unnamed protein product [Linum trigynum]|uniref:Uncharacterized protein n=1 Tax=Linum trigynum TaxID=586398 RepID=A0AAV2CDF9_9ROSI